MPLFIFLSGLFAYKGLDDITTDNIRKFLCKKTVRILLPFLFVGGFYSLIVEHCWYAVYTGTFSGYWFLPALFYCMVLGLLQRILVNQISGGVLEVITFLVIWGMAAIFLKLDIKIPYWLAALKMYPYFMVGHYFSKYHILTNGSLNKQWLQATAIIMYIVAIVFTKHTNFHFISLTGIFAIIILLNLFANHANKLPMLLAYVGKYSLEIYVIHWFFLPKMQDWGDYILSHNSYNENIVLTTAICIIICAIIISFCMFIAFIIKQSSILNYLCLGIKK